MAQETGIILIGLKYVEKLAGNPITLFFLLWLGGFTICSYIFTGDFFAWWRPLNFTLFVTFAGLALIASGSWYLITRYRITKMSNIRGPLIVGIPDLSQGWLNIGSLDYNGVKWNVRVPRLPFYQRRYRLEDVPSVIDIEDPRCPHCNTILNEAKTFWGNIFGRVRDADSRKNIIWISMMKEKTLKRLQFPKSKNDLTNSPIR